jgi:NDP-sugar pyrophosphorylase family protein
MGAYTGVQIVEPALVDRLPASGPCDVLRTAYRQALDQRVPINAVFVPRGSFWIDVGTVERYLSAHEAILAGRLEVPGLPRVDAAARVADDAWISPHAAVLADARIGGAAHLRAGVFIDRGAVVAAGADLKRCVVWPGARVAGTLRDAVVRPTRSGPG